MKIKQVGIWCWIALMVVVMWSMPSRIGAQQPQPAAAAPAAVEKPVPAMDGAWSNPLPSGTLSMGLHFGDQQAETFGDILVPVMQFKSGLLFINPRGTWNDDDGQEFNLGLGYRHLFPERNIIVGGNLFYDLRNTALDNTFNQFGAGLEFLSTWFDARVNVYLPETGKKTADEYTTATGTTQEQGSYWYEPTGQGHLITQYGYDVTSTYDVKTMQHYQIMEQAMEGYDFEFGGLLPIPVVRNYADVKVFGGYYDYNAHFGDDISGVKGRLEIKPIPSLYLDAAWFEDKELLGSHYSVGARVSVPFDLANLSRGKNPFAGALDGFKPGAPKPAFASRMTEMVVRDLHIRSDVSKPQEVVQDRRILEKKLTGTDRKDYNVVLASDVTFVDDDNRSGVENGSWENPYRKINTGVQSAVGTMVYVRDAAQQYYENVVLRDGMTLWGSGAPIYGQGNRYLGGIYPIVNGMGTGPAITLANHVTVAGFEITQSPPAFTPNKGPSISAAGIYGENVTDVYIHHNYIHGTENGIQINAYSVPSVTAEISDNRIEDIWSYDKRTSSGDGISINLYGVPDVDLILANNEVTRCGGNGVMIYADGDGGNTFLARVSGNYSGNGDSGVQLTAANYDMAAAMFVDTVANNNQGHGIDVGLYDNLSAAALFASHTDLDRLDQLANGLLGGLLGDGFSLGGLLGVSGLYREGGAMQANGNGGDGISISQQSTGINLAALLGIQADRNGQQNLVEGLKVRGGAGISVYQSGSAGNAEVSIAALIRCQANGNFGDGMRLYSSADGIAVNALVDVTANDNFMNGVSSRVYSENGLAGAIVLASDPVLSLVGTLVGGDMGGIPAYGQVQANRNGGSGISIYAEGYDLALGIVLDAQANDNGGNVWTFGKRPSLYGNGVEVTALSENGTAIGLVGSTEALIGLLSAEGIPIDLSQVRTLGPLQVNGNADNGISLNVHSFDGDAIAGILGVEAVGNGQFLFTKSGIGGDGIYLDVSSENQNAMAGLAWVNASENGSDGIYADVSAHSMYGEAMLGGINIKANDNMANGMNLNVHSQSSDSSYLVLAGVEANRNINGSGVAALLTGDGTVMAAMTDIQANENGSHGIQVQTVSGNGDSTIWISGTAVQDMSDYGGGWDLLGMDLLPLVSQGSIEVNGNGDNGIYINSMGFNGDVRVNVEDVTASGNRRHGVLAELNSSSGMVYGSFTNIVANNNNNGLKIEATSQNSGLDLSVENVEAMSNQYNGINALLSSYGRTEARFVDNTTEQNGNSGLRVEATTGNGNIILDMASNTANDNDANGIKTLLSSANNIDARFTDNEMTGNGADGLNVNASASQRLKLFGEGNTATGNGDDGIDVKTSAATGAANRKYDFGGGTLGSAGYNVMANNGDYDMERSGAGAFDAQYNYWDGIVPVYGSEYIGNNMNVANALTP